MADAEKALNAVRAALPKPIIDWAQPMPYPVLQALFDPLLPKGLQWYWKGDFVNSLPDAAIDCHIAHAAKLPSPISGMHLYPIDGAVHRQRPDATAWSYRDTTWSMVIVGVGPDPAMAPVLKQWARGYWEAVHPFNLRRRLHEFHDGRRGRGARQSGLWRQLPTTCCGEEAIRPRQSVPGQSKYPSCRIGDAPQEPTMMQLAVQRIAAQR